MMTTKDPSVRWISNAYYWVFHFFSIFFSKFGVYTKGRAKVVGYVLEREQSPNLPQLSELPIGRVGFNQPFFNQKMIILAQFDLNS